jgi:hypothetical protein
MRGIPLAVPLAWTCPVSFFLQVLGFSGEIGSDCLRHRGYIR